MEGEKMAHIIKPYLKRVINPESVMANALRLAFKPSARKDYRLRSRLKNKKQINWWLIYGAARTGTTYMLDMIASCSQLWISDWCLDNILKLVPEFDYIKFDNKRLLRDISNNILDNACLGSGDPLEFAVKEAYLEYEEYKMLVRMWGPPSRAIFCFRQPAGYISSAGKHFKGPYEISLNQLQELYIKLFESHQKIGGDVFEYGSHLTMDDYISFLKPLKVDKRLNKEFVYKGKDSNEHTTEAMWVAYHDFKKTNR